MKRKKTAKKAPRSMKKPAKADAMKRRLSAEVTKAKARAAMMKAKLSGKSQQGKEETEKYVRKNPWQALGLAALAGAVAGFLFRRKK